MDEAGHNVATTSDAESSAATQRRFPEGHHEDSMMTGQSQTEIDKLVHNYERFLLERADKVKCFVHKVHSGLRDAQSAKHYEPIMLSVGPYHHGKIPVQDMEMHKIYYQEVLLRKVGGESTAIKEKALQDEQGKPQIVLDCYRDTHKMVDPTDFEKCMVLDGCFMIELFRRNLEPDNYKDSSHDILSNIRWIKPRLVRDMLLFENQMPLFILLKLFKLTELTVNQGGFVQLVLSFFEFNGEKIPHDVDLKTPLENIPHLLGLIYEALVSGERKKPALVHEPLEVRITETPEELDTETPAEQNNETPEELDIETPADRNNETPKDQDTKAPVLELNTAGKLYKFMRRENALVGAKPVQPNREPKSWELIIANSYLSLMELFSPETPEQPNNTPESWEFIRTAVALEEVGVTIAKADDDAVFLGIEYKEGVLSIPRLVIDCHTESLFRNLVAYEQYSKNCSLHRVTDYLRVMDCLINTSKDVQLLRHRGIIDNGIGDDEKVSTMFNQLCSGVYFNKKEFFYDKMFYDVNKFCKNHRNEWMGKLKNEYFGSPWSVVSFRAAVLLLFLTVVQTVFSVLSYF